MKLAEALQERADLKKNVADLRGRLERVVLVQVLYARCRQLHQKDEDLR